MHESTLYEDNCFITLTYNDDNLPSDNSLKLDHFQKFMKRLRKRFGEGVRFYHCGEYGEKFGRPHYHAIIFNFDFDDKKLWRVINGQRLYVSETLSQLWGHGHVSIGSVTFESAAYVARYILKKVNGDRAEAHYTRIDPETGEVTQIKPEYTTMSRRPGIGKGWFDKFKPDVFPDDFIVVNNKKMKPPKYYDRLLELEDPAAHAALKERREAAALLRGSDSTPARLAVREKVKMAQVKQLKRGLE